MCTYNEEEYRHRVQKKTCQVAAQQRGYEALAGFTEGVLSDEPHLFDSFAEESCLEATVKMSLFNISFNSVTWGLSTIHHNINNLQRRKFQPEFFHSYCLSHA